MSGIVGLVHRDDTRLEGSTLERMLSGLAHRGPDGASRWKGESIGVGHQWLRTSTTDRDREIHETAARPGTGLVVVGDVRLDNRGVLAERLGVTPDRSNAELLALAYRRWGQNCPEHLLGAFAFAVWDHDRGRLFCARDHLGVKPLYYAATDGQFAFASEPPVLFEVDGVTCAPNPTRIAEYLGGHPEDRDDTFYADLSRVPPGHHLTVTDGSVDVKRYWSVAAVDPLPSASTAEYERQFRELFLDAVAVRLPDGDPAGAFLSGGLDSGSIASAAGHLSATRDWPPPDTFSAVFDGIPACDEREFIDAVVERGEVRPHTIRGDRVDPLAGLDRHLAHRGQPFHPSLFMLIWRLYEAVADEGNRVLLHGYGGDQVMGSDVRPYLRGLLRRGQLVPFWRELSGYLDTSSGLTLGDVLLHDVCRPMVPESLHGLWLSRFDDDWFVDRVFAPMDPAFARRISHPDRIREFVRSKPPMSHRAGLEQSIGGGELPFHLELNNIAGAMFGVEPRFPFLDKRVVEFSLGLPPDEAIRDGVGRAIVRNALNGILPDRIRRRTSKTQFSENVIHGVDTYARETIEATLFDGATAVSRYMDMDGVREAFEAFDATPTATDARILLMATTLERWLDGHVTDGSRAESR